jgi:hypothetical protein
MQDPDRLEVELVRVPFGFCHAQVVEHVGEPSDAHPDLPAQAQPHGVGDLCAQVAGGLADEGPLSETRIRAFLRPPPGLQGRQSRRGTGNPADPEETDRCLAEGEGFEPSMDETAHTGFREPSFGSLGGRLGALEENLGPRRRRFRIAGRVATVEPEAFVARPCFWRFPGPYARWV